MKKILKTKKTTFVEEEPVEEVLAEVSLKEELKEILKKKAPGIFDREPSAAYNGNLDKLVDEINSLYKYNG